MTHADFKKITTASYFTYCILLAVLISLITLPIQTEANSSVDGVWTQNHLLSRMQKSSAPNEAINSIALLADTQMLSQKLSGAPNIQQKALGHSGVILYLPLDDGSFTNFEVFESSHLSATTSATKTKFFKAFGINRPELIGHLDIGVRGFHGMILGSDKAIYIDPNFEIYKKEKQQNKTQNSIPNQYRAFKLDKPSSFQCGFENHATTLESTSFTKENTLLARQSGSELNHYDIAVTVSAEYAEAVSSEGSDEQKIAETLSAIETAINRINVIYNQDLSIQLDLVNDPDLIILDPEANPFNNDADSDIAIVTQKINEFIGSANYDIGHLFTVSGGGVAFLGSVCSNTNKGKGVTGVNVADLQSDAFYVDYVAHEIGHQFGANHTFNGTSGLCSGNRNSSTAFEPGSGSTIMAYAGICDAQSLQNNSDPYFHAGSIDEIVNFISNPSTGGSCKSTSTINDNTPPTVDAGSNHTIPANTPFKLSASGNDIDEDPITYTWEQMDVGTSTSNETQMKQDNGNRTLFRSFPGTSNPTRYFPSFDDVLDDTLTIGETYPTTNRNLTFRVTARSGLYGTATNSENPIVVRSVNTGSAFAVIEPQIESHHFESSDMNVLWNVADTHTSPINCSEVDILIAHDGGLNYESFSPLVENTENDGFAKVTLPSGTTSTARLLIQCSDNIFYNINNGDFNIINANESLLSINVNISNQIEGDADFKEFVFTITRTGELNQTSSVNYLLAGFGQHPTNSNDFTDEQIFSGNISFLSSETEKTIVVRTQGDTLSESDEQFSLTLNNPINSLLSTSIAVATINNDDTPEPEPKKNKSSGGSLFYLEMLFIFLLIFFRKISKLFFITLVSIYIGACSPTQKLLTTDSTQNATQTTTQESNKETIHPQVQALLWVNSANSITDAKQAISNKEFIFLASDLRGKIIIPGLTETQQHLAIKQGYRTQEGMGDLIISEQHQALRQQFLDYATQFNQLLANYLFPKQN